MNDEYGRENNERFPEIFRGSCQKLWCRELSWAQAKDNLKAHWQLAAGIARKLDTKRAKNRRNEIQQKMQVAHIRDKLIQGLLRLFGHLLRWPSDACVKYWRC